MRFLLTNDDGIDAPGLAALEQALEGLGHLHILAPADHQSGCSHRATTDRHMLLDRRAEQRHAIDGTPVDCTRVGLVHLVPDADWVVSGINEGGNLGADVYLSGTVAAVREAALLGRPGVALSQYRSRRGPCDWSQAARWARQVLESLIQEPHVRGTFWNVNLPDLPADSPLPPVVHCPMDPHPLPVEFVLQGDAVRYCGNYQARARVQGHDVDVCFTGGIAVTRLVLAS